METQLTKLIITINRLSQKLSSVCKDLDKISEILQDPEIVASIYSNKPETLSPEDYD